jgi:transposase InsO family protein
LAEQMTLSGINQLWVADITYIRLEAEFVYLAVVIDAFSRRVIGWALNRSVEDDLTLAALRMALELRCPPAGCVHHSDHGSQYASGDYTDLLKTHGCGITMGQIEPLGKCGLRVVDEDPEIRRGVSAGIAGSGGGAGFDRPIHR